MRPILMLIAAVFVAACSNPGLYAGVGIGAGGLRVTPVASANIGGATVSVRP